MAQLPRAAARPASGRHVLLGAVAPCAGLLADPPWSSMSVRGHHRLWPAPATGRRRDLRRKGPEPVTGWEPGVGQGRGREAPRAAWWARVGTGIVEAGRPGMKGKGVEMTC